MTNAYRKDFPLLTAQDIAYLDNAATAQRPQCALDAVRRFYCEQNANPLRGLYPLSIAATDAYENAREAVRRRAAAEPFAPVFSAVGRLLPTSFPPPHGAAPAR